MYAIVDRDTLAVIGQAHRRGYEPKHIYIPIDQGLYSSLLDNPSLYRAYSGLRQIDGSYTIRPKPKLTYSNVRMVHLDRVVSADDLDVVFEVTSTTLTMRSKHSGLEPVTVLGVLDEDLRLVCVYTTLELNTPFPHLLKDTSRLSLCMSKPVTTYKYGVVTL